MRMPGVSKYEREQIDALLQATPMPIQVGAGLALFDAADALGRYVYDAAVAPALDSAGLNRAGVEYAFSDRSDLAAVARAIQSAEVIVADVSTLNPSILYCLGLAHALGRYPILLTRIGHDSLPFNLGAVRVIRYRGSQLELRRLRERLGRMLRVWLAVTRRGDR